MADANATGVPSTVECVRSDNGNDVVRAAFMEVLGHRGIRREYIPVDSPKRNGVVGRYIAMTLETTMVSCLEAPRLFGDTRLP